MAGLTPTVFVEVELGGVGLGWTNIATDTLFPSGLTIRHGIDGSGPADLVATVGHCAFALNNSEKNTAATLGYYSLYHASKRTGWGLGINCRIRMTDPTTAITTTRFRGRIDAIDPVPGIKRERRVNVTVVDWMDEALRWALTAAIGEQIDKSQDQVLTNILAQMTAQPVATNFEVGSERYAFALDTSRSNRQSAFAEFGKLAASEYGPFYIKADGTFTAKNRHARLLNTTSVWTIPDTAIVAMSLPSTRDEIINTVRVTSHPRIVDPSITVVYSQVNTIPIAAGATQILLGPYRDQTTKEPIGATEVIAPVSGTDYRFLTRDDGSGVDITSSLTMTATIGAAGVRFSIVNTNAALGYLTLLQLRGRGLKDRATVDAEARDATSITTNGERVVRFDMPYQENIELSQGLADYILAKYKNALAQVRTITVVGKTTALVTQILTRDIDDRITVSETVTGVANDYFINGIELRVRPDANIEATYTLVTASDPFASAGYWVLGTSVLGTNTIPAPF